MDQFTTKPQAGLREKRLRDRHARLMARAHAKPGSSFPEMMETDAELQGLYGFCNGKHVSLDKVMHPHFVATAEKARATPRPILVHDSSWFSFPGSTVRKGLGRVGSGKAHEGFLGHFTLGLSDALSRLPLGLLHLSTLSFTAPPRKRGVRPSAADAATLVKKSARWLAGMRASQALLGPGVKPLHVCDREGDDYSLFAGAQAEDLAYIVRVRYERMVRLCPDVSEDEDLVEEELLPLRQALSGLTFIVEREVTLSSRTAKQAKASSQPERKTRKARLGIRAGTVEVERPASRSAKECPVAKLKLNVVQVVEQEPPEGEQAVEWLLVTSEPIGTKEEVEAVVETYRARWVIEEYFKALKTGCAYEKRELESLKALENALGLLAPVAVELLKLKHVAREEPEAPATKVLKAEEVKVLRTLSKRVKLGENPTAQEVLLAVAGVGGHLKQNGAPGWMVIYRGFRSLNLAMAGWRAAQSM